MTTDEALVYLLQRIANLSTRHRDQWPQWTNKDFCAVGVVMSGMTTKCTRLTKALLGIMNAYGLDSGADPEVMFDIAEAALKEIENANYFTNRLG